MIKKITNILAVLGAIQILIGAGILIDYSTKIHVGECYRNIKEENSNTYAKVTHLNGVFVNYNYANPDPKYPEYGNKFREVSDFKSIYKSASCEDYERTKDRTEDKIQLKKAIETYSELYADLRNRVIDLEAKVLKRR